MDYFGDDDKLTPLQALVAALVALLIAASVLLMIFS
jgi:hypothetical protein